MLTRLLLLLSLAITTTACLDERTSPNRSGAASPSPTPISKQVEPTIKNDTPSQMESCAFYPSRYIQPDWNTYFSTFADKTKDGMTLKPFIAEIRNGSELKPFYLIYNKVSMTSNGSVAWVDKIDQIDAQSIEGCSYPSVKRLQIKQDKYIYIVDEWRTKTFFQPRLVVFEENGHVRIWQDVFTGSRTLGLPLYREVLSDAEQKVFLRRRYGVFDLKLDALSAHSKPVANLRLMITNRSNAIVGNLAIKYQNSGIEVQLGPIEAFKVWNDNSGKYKYIVEFGAEAPRFVGDTHGVISKRAGGNFNKATTRIRLIYDEHPINTDLPFSGEYIQHNLQSTWIHFSGSRPARPETFE